MGYKLLGFIVWRGARFYVRRRYPDAPRKVAMGVVGTALVGGVAVAVVQRSRSSSG